MARYWDPFMELFDDPDKIADVRGLLYGPHGAARAMRRLAERSSSAVQLMSGQASAMLGRPAPY